ncbi:MAG: AAA family ATPase, partial [Desulfomonile sp.]|nr:AAA family ATPase [Desulfomonile sp.]
MLEIKKLGPIGKLVIHPRPLTILIGEQASGKSLVAQLLYFFRGLQSHVGRIYRPGLSDEEGWQAQTLRRILDGLRGVPFGYFANKRAALTYTGPKTEAAWEITVTYANRVCRPKKKLASEMGTWVREWQDNPLSLGETRKAYQIFIPTERSVFTRLYPTEPSVLYAEYQPEPLRMFSLLLEGALRSYPRMSHRAKALLRRPSPASWVRAWRFVLNCQRLALGGEAFVPTSGPKKWKWQVGDEEETAKLPIEATASGQMEAWPFFVVACAHGIGWYSRGEIAPLDFYFEEPETHLHPRAQWEVMKAVVYLVTRLGHSFVITTHSPFIAYAINNMIQRFLSFKGEFPEEEVGINPNMVAAYRLKASPDREPEDIMDRKQTNLIKLDELDSVADEMG